MTVLTTSAGKLSTRAASRAAGYRVELTADWPTAVARWNAFDPSTPFQHAQWYAAWYGAFAGQVEPLIAFITDAVTGEQAALLPLILRRQQGVRIVEFADLDITDYNAPLLGPAAPRDARAARTLWHNLRAALRRMPQRRSHPSAQARRRSRRPAQPVCVAR
jgi:CelD/BcsL family acetyltransferase involved in cellulose biosynthesis